MTMHPADSDDLAKQVDRALRALPTPRAPRTLVPRVMAAVEQSLAPWYSRAWVTWPAVWQIVSAAALVLLVVGVARIGPAAEAVADVIGSRASVAMPASVVAFISWAGSFIDAGRILWRVIVEPVIGYLVLFVVVMCVACLAFGTALNRVALGGASDL